MAEPIINDPTKEIGYFAKRSGLFAVGKQTAEAAGHSFAGTFEATAGSQAASIGSSAAGYVGSSAVAFKGLGGIVTIGLAATVSAVLTQMDYIHRKDNLKDLYKEELSHKLHKPAKKLTRDDLDEASKSNHVIDEEMHRNRKQRNYGIALSFMASMASLAVVMIVLPEVLTLAFGAIAAEAAVAGIGGFFLKAAVGLVTYHAVKDPLHWVADKLFGIDERTTNDLIVNIKRDREAGKIISREQIMAVFVASNPELDKYIVSEYGKHFDDLPLGAKQKATQELSHMLPLDKLTLEINSGKVNVSELAFAVEGQASGVSHTVAQPHEERRPGLLVKMLAGLGTAIGGVKGGVAKVIGPDAASPQEVSIGSIMQASKVAVEKSHHSEDKQKSFVNKLSGQAAQLSHVERLEQSREHASATLGIPT